MRVSNNMNYNQVKGSIEKNRSEVSDLQNQASSMKRITKPSDDPVGTARTLGLRTDGTGLKQNLKNLDQAKTFLSFTESALGDLSEILIRAKELAVSQASDPSSNAASRMATSTEVDQIYKDIVSMGNRRYGERYIFGGYKTTTEPFDADGNYKGDEGAMRVEVAKGVFTAMNIPGDRIFLGRDFALAQVPEARRGALTPNYPAAPELDPEKPEEREPVDVRGPASLKPQDKKEKEELQEGSKGENIFSVIKALSNGLRANDTTAIQETLERIDSALEQVVTLRAQAGSRLSSLNTTSEALSKQKIDQSALISSIEDADTFEVFTDITKNENTLKATLQTSGKLIQPSLLDFLR